MTISTMLQQSGILAVLGMAVVFIFLCIMIFCINSIGKLIRLRTHETEADQFDGNTRNNPDGTIPPEHVAAISAAVAESVKKD